MSKQESCQERIWDHYKGRAETLRYATGRKELTREIAEEEGWDFEDFSLVEYYNADLLSINVGTPGMVEREEFLLRGCPAIDPGEIAVELEISTGGPADGYIIYIMPGRYGPQITSAYYYFQDWFDGAVMVCDGEVRGMLADIISDLADLGQFEQVDWTDYAEGNWEEEEEEE